LNPSRGLEVRASEVLRAARLVEADIEDADTPGNYRFAIVNTITAEGRAALARDAGNKPIA
jgi:hypothetical protein